MVKAKCPATGYLCTCSDRERKKCAAFRRIKTTIVVSERQKIAREALGE